MKSGFDHFIALETELSQKLEAQITTFNSHRSYGKAIFVLFSVLTFLIIATVVSSLFQQISTDIRNTFPTFTLLEKFPLLGGFVALIVLSFFTWINLWLQQKLDIHQRVYWVWWIWLYATSSITILLIMAYQTRPFNIGSYLPQVKTWFIFSFILLASCWVFIQFCVRFMPRVAWLWLLSVTPPKLRSSSLPGYIQLLKDATQDLSSTQDWDRATWERIHAMATTRLSAANGHAQSASFILAAIAFIGILPTIAERAWRSLMALTEGYFRSFAQTEAIPDAELWVQSLILLIVAIMVFFTLRYFTAEAWHLRLAEIVIYLAEERLSAIPPTAPSPVPLIPATPTISVPSLLVGAGVATLITWVLRRPRN